MQLRRPTEGDTQSFLSIRRELAYDLSHKISTAGGFLLGSDAAGYRKRMHDSQVWVVDDGQVQGFAIVLPDLVFRNSDIWERRDAVQWFSVDPDALAAGRLCYFDQLAVRRGCFRNRRWGAALALHALRTVMNTHDHFVATTVSDPVLNLAAVPYLMRIGARKVGRIQEFHPSIGALVSEIWLLSRQEFEQRLLHPRSAAERWLLDVSREVDTPERSCG